MDMIRMNKILHVKIEDRLVVVQPGVVYQNLQDKLTPYNFFYPPEPASLSVCTLGGNVATNAGGYKGAKYGVTKDYVLGLEVVLADGRILRTGSQCIKTASGYDLTRLFVGSEGTLGVITEIILKINPKPKAVATTMVSFSKLDDAGKAVTDIMFCGAVPSVCEFVDGNLFNLLLEHTDLDMPKGEAMLFIECDALTQTEADYQMDQVIKKCHTNCMAALIQAKSSEETTVLWKWRMSISKMKKWIAPLSLTEDVNVPIGRIKEYVSGIEAISQKHGLALVNFGHAGDGNFHPNVLYHENSAQVQARIQKVLEDLFRLVLDLGGTLTGEHGIGLDKARYMTWEHNKITMDVMKGIKNFFDPNNILNPGKMGLESE